MTETTDIVRAEPLAITAPQEPQFFMPIVEVKRAIERREMIKSFTQLVMVDGQDYGTIPGTGPKKTLLKPGAEKLTSFFGMIPEFSITREILDFDGTGEGNGEALIYYRIRCDLYRAGVKVGSADASCSSREGRYRWRTSQRKCPVCQADAVRKGAEKFGGGWYCDRKIDGCGARFDNGDQRIENQVSGRSANEDIADLDNTILKMGEKRALVAATLIATNVSDFFTQDIEDGSAPQATMANPPAPRPKPKIVKPTQPPAPVVVGVKPVWAAWTTPQDAYAWAVSEQHVTDTAEAGACFKALVERDFSGRLTATNRDRVFESYVQNGQDGNLLKILDEPEEPQDE